MPRIIDYPIVIQCLQEEGFRSLYYNSGAFGFSPEVVVRAVGWVGPEDDSIRPEVRHLLRPIPPPHAANLARLATGIWQRHLPGTVWAMPKSHWAYELDHGSRDWMPQALRRLGIDPALLQHRTDAAAIGFAADEESILRHFLQSLLEHLHGSDFMLTFPGRRTLCTVHHHQQLWWQTSDESLAAVLDDPLSANF